MIRQVMPRKRFPKTPMPENKGFFIDGRDFEDCYKQLSDYAKEHPEKWIYYYNCGIAPGYPIPVATQVFEVVIYDKEPASLMIFYKLFQEGCDMKREIDDMSEEEKAEMTKKHLNFFAMIGSTIKEE